MQYLGGKSRLAKHIAPVLMAAWQPGMAYYEPFVGAGSVLVEMCKRLPSETRKLASDIHPDLILMWKALQQGWVPPVGVTEEQYNTVRKQLPSELRGFVGFGCSFGGKWFGGYARNTDGRNYAKVSATNLMSRIQSILGVEFKCADYRELQPNNALIYCDPPYKGRTGYKDAFDHQAFWETMRSWSQNNKVFVSEYTAPSEFGPVAQFDRKQDLRSKADSREAVVDRLFCLV